MNHEIPDWERKYYSPAGGDPFLYYVAFGNIRADAQISAAYYRCTGIPQGVQLTSYTRAAHRDVFDMFMRGYLWEQLQEENPLLAADVQSAPGCIVLQGELLDPNTLNYMRDTIGLLTFFVDNGATVIYDPQMFQWWSPESWREKIFDPGEPVPRHHTVILISKEEDPQADWIHTRGMRKFGRPDISVRHVMKDHLDGVIDLCNRFIEYQAFGGVISEGQEIRMASLPRGGIARHGGDLEDPDFNNVHVEITWHGGNSKSNL